MERYARVAGGVGEEAVGELVFPAQERVNAFLNGALADELVDEDYADYRNFQSVIESARTACFNSGQRVEDHFVDVTDMIAFGKGAKRPAKTVMMSRYACYLVIQNADPGKQIVAQGQTYFAIQTRRQELIDEEEAQEAEFMIKSCSNIPKSAPRTPAERRPAPLADQ